MIPHDYGLFPRRVVTTNEVIHYELRSDTQGPRYA